VDQQLIDALGGPPDLVLSDMAHNTVGHRQTDHLKIIALIEIASDFAIRTLRPGGHFVTKNFQGGDAGRVLADLRANFQDGEIRQARRQPQRLVRGLSGGVEQAVGR
jgi:23S rRNA (uridine2552-2'-O)-methyltransferase